MELDKLLTGLVKRAHPMKASSRCHTVGFILVCATQADLLTFWFPSFGSYFGRGPKSLTCYCQALWATEATVIPEILQLGSLIVILQTNGCGSKSWYQNGPLESGSMTEACGRGPSLTLSHTQIQFGPSASCHEKALR